MPIFITSKRDGFRRCGVDHPSTRTEYPDGTFTAEQVKALQSESMLVVELTSAGQSAKTPNVGETVALVLAATTVEELDQLAEGDTRKGVTDAIAKRRAELQPPA